MTRPELYELVWKTPISQLAKIYGISDAAFRKICAAHSVPTPGNGYWAKLQFGKEAEKTPLPPAPVGDTEVDLLQPVPKAPLPPNVVRPVIVENEVPPPKPRVAVPAERPTGLHPVAAATEKALLKAKVGEDGFVAIKAPTVLDIRIGPGSIKRAVLLSHALLEAAQALGIGTVAGETIQFLVDEQPLAVRIFATTDKFEHIPTPAEQRAQAQQEAWRAGSSHVYQSNRKAYRAWDHVASDRLVLEIYDPLQKGWKSDPLMGRWLDRQRTRVEDSLLAIVGTFAVGAAKARTQREREAEDARLAKEAEDRHREQELRRRLLDKASKFLMEKVDKHEALLKLERLASHLRGDVGRGDQSPVPQLEEMLDLVLAHLRRQVSAQAVNDEIVERELLNPDRWY